MHNTRLASLTVPVERTEKGSRSTIRANMIKELRMSNPSYALVAPSPRFRGEEKKQEVR